MLNGINDDDFYYKKKEEEEWKKYLKATHDHSLEAKSDYQISTLTAEVTSSRNHYHSSWATALSAQSSLLWCNDDDGDDDDDDDPWLVSF